MAWFRARLNDIAFNTYKNDKEKTQKIIPSLNWSISKPKKFKIQERLDVLSDITGIAILSEIIRGLKLINNAKKKAAIKFLDIFIYLGREWILINEIDECGI